MFAPVRELVCRMGPAVWRLPPELRRRLVREARLGKLAGARLYRFGAAEKIRPTRPARFWGRPTFGQRLAARPHRLRQPFVVHLPGAWLVGRHAAPVTTAGRILLTSFRDQPGLLGLEPQTDLLEWVRAAGWNQRRQPPDFRHLCSLVGRLDPNYFHWMIESCGQIEGIEAYVQATGSRPRLLVRGGAGKFVRESLELLGWGNEVVEWPAEAQPAWVDGLVLASLPGNGAVSSPRSLRWLRDRFLAGAGAEPAGRRRLYIPRRPGGWRSVLNDDEVVARMRAEGFDIVSPEKLSLAEQIRLFSQASLIVAMHGAALTNLLFAPRAAVLELTGSYGGGEYYSMASGLEMRYASIRCQASGDNVVVDVPALVRTIEQFSHG